MPLDEPVSDAATGAYFAYTRTEIAPLLPDRTERVLEIGCGAGGTLKWLRGQRTVKYAVGYEAMAEHARTAAAFFDVMHTVDVETATFPNETFDLILALDVLEHLVDPWAVVKRLHPLLAPGGAIIASIPNIGHYSVAIPLVLRNRWNYEDEGILDRTHLRFFTRHTAVELLTCSGLVLDKLDRTRLWQRRYAMKLVDRLMPRALSDYQYLIRVRAS